MTCGGGRFICVGKAAWPREMPSVVQERWSVVCVCVVVGWVGVFRGHVL